MDQKNTILGVFFMSILLQQSHTRPLQKSSANVWDRLVGKKYVHQKLFTKSTGISWIKSNNNDNTSWLQKRTSYTNPCNATLPEPIDTSSLDKAPLGQFYIPAKLKESKCEGKMLNGRNKYECLSFSGDCVDIEAPISVRKYFNAKVYVSVEVTLKVGCACMIPT